MIIPETLRSTNASLSRSWIRNVPLLIAYIIFPAVSIIGNLFFTNYLRQWIDVLWLVMLVLSFIVLANRQTLKSSMGVFAATSIFLAYMFGSAFYVTFEISSLITFLVGFKCAFLLFVSIGIAAAFGIPDRSAFLSYGVLLAILLIFGCVVEMIMAGQVIRPDPTGEINYEAALLILSLIVADINKIKRCQWLAILIAILFSMSRTALIVLVVISFIKFRIGLTKQFILLIAATTFFFASYLMRGLEIDSYEQIDRFWMWLTWFEAMDSASLTQFLFGFGPGVALPVDVPKQLTWLWENQQEITNTHGIFSYNFHAFWARFSIDYGVLAAILLLSFCIYPFLRLRSNDQIAFASFVLIEGLTMGLFYLSSVAVPAFLAGMLIVSSTKMGSYLDIAENNA